MLAEAPRSGTCFLAALQMGCLPRAGDGGVGSGQLIFAAFSYLLLGKWNGVLERSAVARCVHWRGWAKGTGAPPSLQVTWQAGTCKNQFYTRAPYIQQAALLVFQ